jgi:hypothetical protein
VDELPGGYWDPNGQLHRAFELAALNGRDEEHLAAAGAPPATLVTELLSRRVRRIGDISPVPPEVARQLLVADRNYLLLRLRQATFGDRVRANLFCPWPDCGEHVSVDFSIADLPVEQAAHRAPLHTMTLCARDDGPPTDVTFRLPNGADQEEVSALLASNEAAALTVLLSRCITRIGPHESPDEPRIAALPATARADIERRMEELAPKVGQAMDITCAECGRGFTAPFDIQRFFFGDLRTDDDLLYREVHYLAYHYHWGEDEIMQLTRDKRQKYIEVLADAIEGLNRGA